MKKLHSEYLSEVFKEGLIKQDTFSIHSFIDWEENKDIKQKEFVKEVFTTLILPYKNGLWLKDENRWQ